MDFNKIRKIFHRIFFASIQNEVLAAILLTAIIPSGIIGVYSNIRINEFIDREIEFYNSEIVKQVGRKIEYVIQGIEITETQLTWNIVSSNLFSQYERLTIPARLEAVKDTNTLLNSLKQAFPFIHSIYLINQDMRIFSSSKNFDQEILIKKKWIKDFWIDDNNELFISAHTADYYELSDTDNKIETISFLKRIKRLRPQSKNVIILIDINYQKIREMLSGVNLGQGGVLYLIDSNDTIISSSDNSSGKKEEILSFATEKGSYITDLYELEDKRWTIFGVVPEEFIMEKTQFLRYLPLIITLFVILISSFIAMTISRRITQPLAKLIYVIENTGEKNFFKPIPDIKSYDLQKVISAINRMKTRLKLLIENIQKKEKEKNIALFNAFNAQINPHFLYNSLDVIRGISLSKGNEDVADIAASLAMLFRYSIDDNKEKVLIQDELGNLKNYINIQKYRFGNRFRVVYEVEKRIEKKATIRLILQPIVENAFKHSIEKILSNGLLEIYGKMEDGNIFIEIRDNGPGIDNEKAEFLNKIFLLENTGNLGKKYDIGIGLLNVNSRIKLHYGTAYGLTIIRRKPEGTSVILKLPVEEDL